ncbi:MAG: hypothetical protein CVV22_06130 [Ignavibacteriae bacterium HGW-Ignavibacteriae-1]|nr:MAG: hypothetical protein CVV22_06130 [Ignavibacteriae bacterium HGW-Ignavibacteriae-1]
MINNTLYRTAALFLLIAIVFTTYNFTLNGHYHRTEEGVLIYHYHPYEHDEDSNSSESKHSHTQLQLVNLQSNSDIRFCIVLAVVILNNQNESTIELHITDFIPHITSVDLLSPQLRAPPAL